MLSMWSGFSPSDVCPDKLRSTRALERDDEYFLVIGLLVTG